MTDWREPITIVSVNVFVFRDGKLLLGKRKGGQAAGEWGTPSGRLEHMEGIEACARRELMEECGIEVGELRFSSVANVTAYPPRHVVLLTFVAEWKSGEVANKEPEKCEELGWFDVDHLPEPMTDGMRKAIEAYRTEKPFFDAP